MCGIAGCVDARRPDLRDVLVSQLRTLDHRGPDSWGSYDSPGCSIGQTRLAVVDLVTGDPPLTSEDGEIGVALNGEIYGFQEIRQDLLRRGHDLASAGDTEVIAHLAEDLEPAEVARRLDGMFAFAVYDRRRRRLVLGRDRFGKKPLYYWHSGDVLVFGSEIKALLRHPSVTRHVDDDAVRAYLAMGSVPSPATIYSGVRSLPPAHVLVLDHGRPPVLQRYWQPQLRSSGDPSPSLRTAATEVRRQLSAAVGRRLVADVPVGAFLSGGVDSSAVVALMAEQSSLPVQTFTIGFDDEDGYDERPYARLVARRFATEHHEFVVRPDAVDLVERLVDHHDQPFGDATSVPTYLLSELTRKHVTVALCGDGGDEVFAGYERFGAAAALARLGGLPGARRLLPRAAGLLPAGTVADRLARSAARAATPMPEAMRSWVTYFSDQRLAELGVAPSLLPARAYAAAWAESAGAPTLHRLLHLNMSTYLLDDLLPKVDRTAMAHGLEVRSPFLDADLVEHALRLPARHLSIGTSRKRVLRAAMRGDLPREVLARGKRGFGMPLDRWFREDLAAMAGARLLSPDARLRRYVDGAQLERMWHQHQAGRDLGFELWLLLTLEVFLRREP
jgi:asparagine synthase (glutamine-hydrolysing)